MAIQLARSTENDDYPEAYWRIDEVNANYRTEVAHIVVGIYKTRAAANNKKKPIDAETFDLQASEGVYPAFSAVLGIQLYKATKTDQKELVYNWLKTLPLLAGALDVP
jgi:hypothetical protein